MTFWFGLVLSHTFPRDLSHLHIKTYNFNSKPEHHRVLETLSLLKTLDTKCYQSGWLSGEELETELCKGQSSPGARVFEIKQLTMAGSF